MYLVVIGLVVKFNCVQAQDKKTSADSANIVEISKQESKIPTKSCSTFGPTEELPQFPGGEAELLKFIYNNLRKPSIDDGCQVMGKVVCRFIIDIDGSVIQPEVIRSLTLSCDKEAIRVIKLLPKFTPGKQNKKNIRVWYTIPITFKPE